MFTIDMNVKSKEHNKVRGTRARRRARSLLDSTAGFLRAGPDSGTSIGWGTSAFLPSLGALSFDMLGKNGGREGYLGMWRERSMSETVTCAVCRIVESIVVSLQLVNIV